MRKSLEAYRPGLKRTVLKPVAFMDNEISQLLLLAICWIAVVLIADWAARQANRDDNR